MSNGPYEANTPGAATPAGGGAPGWYVDPWAQSTYRWWDGSSWSATTSDGTAPAGPAAGRPVQPPLPAGSPPYGPLIWIIAVLPVIAILTSIAFPSDFSLDPVGGVGPLLRTAALSGLLGLLSYAAGVVLALFDWRWLRARGHVRPFHWAFAFIPIIGVYVIGRSVRVHSVLRRGLAPIWLWGALQLGYWILNGVLASQSAANLPFAP